MTYFKTQSHPAIHSSSIRGGEREEREGTFKKCRENQQWNLKIKIIY